MSIKGTPDHNIPDYQGLIRQDFVTKEGFINEVERLESQIRTISRRYFDEKTPSSEKPNLKHFKELGERELRAVITSGKAQFSLNPNEKKRVDFLFTTYDRTPALPKVELKQSDLEEMERIDHTIDVGFFLEDIRKKTEDQIPSLTERENALKAQKKDFSEFRNKRLELELTVIGETSPEELSHYPLHPEEKSNLEKVHAKYKEKALTRMEFSKALGSERAFQIYNKLSDLTNEISSLTLKMQSELDPKALDKLTLKKHALISLGRALISDNRFLPPVRGFLSPECNTWIKEVQSFYHC